MKNVTVKAEKNIRNVVWTKTIIQIKDLSIFKS